MMLRKSGTWDAGCLNGRAAYCVSKRAFFVHCTKTWRLSRFWTDGKHWREPVVRISNAAGAHVNARRQEQSGRAPANQTCDEAQERAGHFAAWRCRPAVLADIG